MNIKAFVFLTLSLIGATQLFSQEEEESSTCETIERTDEEMEQLPWYGNNDYLDQLRTSASVMPIFDQLSQDRNGASCPEIEGMFLIPIKFWIYRDSDNEPGMPSERQLQRMMDRLNFLYQNSGMNVRFYMLCPQFITDADKVDVDDASLYWSGIGGGNSVQNAINVQVVRTYLGATSGGVYYPPLDMIAVTRAVYSAIPSVSTLAHEIGHYFQLEHTHRGFDANWKCFAESVSRTRNFSFPCPKSGKICEKNGDALCDTPADKKLSADKVNSSCIYTAAEKDLWGDTYIPDVSNIMSYSRGICRTSFSYGQTAIMAENLVLGRQGMFGGLDAAETDPDDYEPDDSDFPQVPRAIALGESQCHSFHDLLGCQDPVDWLIMNLSQGVLESYQIKVEDITNEQNPVEEVKVWNIGSDGMRSNLVATTFSASGTTRIWSFPCSTSGDRLLIEVVRKSDVTEGKYLISLTSSRPLVLNGENTLCTNFIYEIEGVPSGSTVTWLSSLNINLSNSTGLTTSVQNIISGGGDYWLEAIVTWNGCTQRIRKIFTYIESEEIPNFNIVEDTPACVPMGLGEFSISNPVNGIVYEWGCQGGPCAFIHTFDNGESATIKPVSQGTMTLSVTARDECGNTRIKTLTVLVKRCPEEMGGIILTPNPSSTGVINVSIQDTYPTDGEYLIYVLNQMSELKYQSLVATKDFSLNLNELPNGTYFLLAYRDEISGSASFIINK